MTTKVRPYQLKSLKTGCEVFGIDLRNVVEDHVVDLIKEDVKHHRLLVFRDQGIVSSERHLEISRWFGVVESTYVSKIRIYANKGILGFYLISGGIIYVFLIYCRFYNHPKSPHRDIFRVSNDRKEG